MILNYFFANTIKKINLWHSLVKGSGLPVEAMLEKLIRDKLQRPLRDLIALSNTAMARHCVRRIDFGLLSEKEVWGLESRHLVASATGMKGRTARERLINLRDQVRDLFPVFLNGIKISASAAELSLEQSLLPLKEEFQEKHPPHLGLLFAFLKLFQYLQDDLNGFTRKHLDFFYRDVLKIKTRNEVPDKAHIIFEIQNQLQKHLLKNGLLVKDGKDENKAEILFSLDDEIVVNKAQVADKRTLFLHNQHAYESTYLKGVYMAPNAGKADGEEIDFTDDGPKSFQLLGPHLANIYIQKSRLPSHILTPGSVLFLLHLFYYLMKAKEKLI